VRDQKLIWEGIIVRDQNWRKKTHSRKLEHFSERGMEEKETLEVKFQ